MKIINKYSLKQKKMIISSFFYPYYTIIFVLVFSSITSCILFLIMSHMNDTTILYKLIDSLLIATITSIPVTVFVEMGNNYRHNKLSQHELYKYYDMIYNFLSDRCNYNEISDRNNEPLLDDVQITWIQLYNIIPVIKDVYENKKDFLHIDELRYLEIILFNYEEIRTEISNILSNISTSGIIDKSNDDYIYGLFPSGVVDSLPTYIKNLLSFSLALSAFDKLTDIILSDKNILIRTMKDFNICLSQADKYKDIDYLSDLTATKQEVEDKLKLRISYEMSSHCLSIYKQLIVLKDNTKKRATSFMSLDILDRINKLHHLLNESDTK